MTNAFTIDTYAEPIRSAFGLSVYTDRVGYVNSWAAKLSYAYYIFIAQNTSIAFGLSGYLRNMNSSVLSNMLEQDEDQSMSYSKDNAYNPDFDFGLEFKGPMKIGASIRHLLKYKPINSFFPAHSINIWSYASYRFNVSNSVSLEPTASYMYRDKLHRMEGGAIIYFFKSVSRTVYNDRFWIGGMYRLNKNKQFAVLAGANLTQRIRLGYSFDYTTGDFTSMSKMGTHELFLSWHFNRIFYNEPECYMYRQHSSRRK
jgi:type IX secretion system PorP/SprF family membrane protein